MKGNYCEIPECGNPRGGRYRYCWKHRARISRHGNPDVVIGLTRLGICERFERQTLKNEFTKCWLWIGTIQNNGYGILRAEGKTKYAHRVSFELHKGPIPPSLNVCHSCDIRNCVNPDHLWVGTQKQNIDDARTKGRNYVGRILAFEGKNQNLTDWATEKRIKISTLCMRLNKYKWPIAKALGGINVKE